MAEGLPGTQPAQEEGARGDPRTEALLNALRERSREDPLVGAKFGAREVFQRLLAAMQDDRGVHAESLLCALGALGGYACQASLRAQAVAKGLPETAQLQVVSTKGGAQYFFGDHLNDLLAGASHSVWSLAGGAAQHAGAKELPDLQEIFGHCASVVGTAHFGVPRVPDANRPAAQPLNYLQALWPGLLPTVKRFCPDPSHWPILYGLAIQQGIEMGKTALDPTLALRIVMESAVPMSKVDLGAPQQQRPAAPAAQHIGTDDDTNDRSYDYKPKKGSVFVSLLLLGGVAIAAGYGALGGGGRGYRGLGPAANSGLLWVVCAVMVGVAAWLLLAARNAFSSTRRVELRGGTLYLPRSGTSNKVDAVRMQDVRHLKVQQVQKQSQLKIAHVRGESTLHASMLPSVADFEDLCRVLAKLQQQAKAERAARV